MNDHADAIPADQASFLTPDMPRPTDGVAPAAPGVQEGAESTPAPAASAAASNGELDAKGTPFDPAKHQTGPDGKGIRTARNTWKLQGDRGRPFGTGNKAAIKVKAQPAADQHQAQPVRSSASFLNVPPAVPETLGPDGVHNPVVTAPEAIGRDQYKVTAQALVRLQFALPKIFISKAWEPESVEAREWTEAWMDALYEWQAPRLGSTLSLFVLGGTTIAKRSEDPETRSFGRRVVRFLFGLVGIRMAPTQQERQTPASQSAPVPQQTGNLSPVVKW